MALHIGDRTVKTHVSSIMGKLGVQSRTQAALYAVRAGLVAASD
jgi:DNA-binding NarL/FixJ family response regulator